MKLKCPHCKATFDELKNSCCPVCNKWILLTRQMKDKLAGKEKNDKPSGRPRKERAGLSYQPAPAFTIPTHALFGSKSLSRVFFWIMILVTLVGVRLLLTSNGPVTGVFISARVERTRKELKVLRTALEWFHADCKRYPTTEEGLAALGRNPGIPGWKGFYIEALCPDLWGQPFGYRCTNDTPRVFSAGPDRTRDTADDVESPAPDYKGLIEDGLIRMTDLPKAATNIPAATAVPQKQ